MANTILPNGYPNDTATHLLSTIAFLLTICVNVILLYSILKSHKNKSNRSTNSKSKSGNHDKIAVLLCLSFSLCRTISWSVGAISLIIMVYKPSDYNKLNDIFVISSIIGYVFQFCYDLSIGYFLKIILEHTYNKGDNSFLQVNTCTIWIYLLIYTLSATIFNIFYMLSAALHKTQYNKMENYASLAWGIVSVLYNILILYAFNKRLKQFLNLLNNANNRRNSAEIRRKSQNSITKQTNLISFIVIAMLTYIIGTYICFHVNQGQDKNNLITWHWMYFITQSVALICAVLTLTFHNEYYMKKCKYCHSFCLAIWNCNDNAYDNKQYLKDSKMQPYDMTNLELQPITDIDTNCPYGDDCGQIISICTLLQHHHDNNHNVLHYIESTNYTPTDITNDFNHLITAHDTDKDFSKIHKQLDVHNNHSHYGNCNTYSRHYARRRNRTYQQSNNEIEEETKQNNNNKDIALMSIMDKMHSYYYHSYDTHLRTNVFDRIYDDDQNQATTIYDESDDDDDVNIDNYVEKFSSNLKGNDNEKIYKFGQKFDYINDRNIWFVDRRYGDFKKELTQNKKCKISMEEYSTNYNKCEYYMHEGVTYCKLLKNRDTSQELTISHILSLLIYCNCTQYQYEWSASFRRKHSNESDISLISRHEHFHHSSKYLIELIECFGDKLIAENNENKMFYHGVSTMLYPTKTTAQFNGPLSTSDELIVAQNFTSNDGMVLALTYSSSLYPFKAKYFNCAKLSDFTNEKECLFVGGIPMMMIVNIYNVNKDQGYYKYLNAINIINCLLNGTHKTFDDEQCVTKERKSMQYVVNEGAIDLCCKLLSNQLIQYNENDSNYSKFPQDVINLTNSYCNGLENIMIFWHHLQSQNIMKLTSLICGEKANKKLLFFDLDILLGLFSNIQQIEYYNESFEQQFASKNEMIRAIIDYILEYKLNNQTRLKYIIIHHKMSSSRHSLVENKYWRIYQDHEKIILYKHNIKFDVKSLKIHFMERKLQKASEIFT